MSKTYPDLFSASFPVLDWNTPHEHLVKEAICRIKNTINKDNRFERVAWAQAHWAIKENPRTTELAFIIHIPCRYTPNTEKTTIPIN